MKSTITIIPAVLLLFASTLAAGADVLDGFDPSGTGPGYPASANGRSGPKPALRAHRVEAGPIEVDGRLDEADWVAADAGTGFTQFEPNRHGEPCEETVIKFMYDDDAFYVGVACYHLNDEPLTTCLSRRDNIMNSDRIRVYIDPYHDLTTGYHFRINPDGVKEDYYNYDDLYHDISWDAVWEADTTIDESGWYAEMRIPFSSVRYRAAESMTWGLNVFRYTDSQGQRTGWSNWDRDQSGFMSRNGTVTDIDGVGAPRQLEILPYVVGSVTDPADESASGYDEEDWDYYGNFGADVKYGVTADLTLNATIQPDFGQVEADPSELNLSPFETYYDEKRPFFVEGAQFFWHPDFTVFYSRRIGTGSRNSRIRFAGKLTGKMAGDVSTAVLVAATDETQDGQAHNPFKSGDRRAVYAIGRFGKQFNGGNYSFNVMQTGVFRDETTWDVPTRNGYVSGADFKLMFQDRMYEVTGSFVGSAVDEKPYGDGDVSDPSPSYGTGSRFEIKKAAGDWTAALTTRHQSDKLDLNDIGYISDPNHYAWQVWVQRDFSTDNDEAFFNDGGVHVRYYQSWIYADRAFMDPDNPSDELWSYESGHDQTKNLHVEGWGATRTCWSFWGGADVSPENTDIYATRRDPVTGEGGPLVRSPAGYSAYAGFSTDYRKDLGAEVNLNWSGNAEDSRSRSVSVGLGWAQNSRMNHTLSVGYTDRHEDAQWLGNFVNPGGGIGGTSYVFAELDQRTWDMTLRSSVLFSRDQSLELYLQPYLTVGDYRNPRELMTPDSYDLQPYGGYDASENDFSYGAVNLNMVYRWEYRPGSTLYLVWSHSRSDFDARGFHDDPNEFTNDFSIDPLVRREAENRFMAKISYWFSI